MPNSPPQRTCARPYDSCFLQVKSDHIDTRVLQTKFAEATCRDEAQRLTYVNLIFDLNLFYSHDITTNGMGTSSYS